MSGPGFEENFQHEIRLVQSQIDQGQISEALDQLKDLEDLELSPKERWELDLTKASVYLELNDLEKTADYVKELGRSDLDNSQQLSLMGLKAGLLFKKGDFSDAQQTIIDALHILDGLMSAEKNNYLSLEAELLNLKGLYLMTKSEYDNAITAFEDARRINEKVSRVRQSGMNLYNIARVHLLNNNPKRAIVFLENARDEFKSVDYAEGLAACYDELIKAHEAIDDTETSFTYTQKKRELAIKIKFEKYKMETAKEKNQLHQQIQDLVDTTTDLEEQIWRLKFELESSVTPSEDKTISETVMRRQEEEIAELEARNIELKEIIDGYKELNPDTTEIDLLKKELSELKADNYEKSKLVSLLEEKIDEKNQQINALKKKLDEVDSEAKAELLESYKKQVQNLSKQLSDNAERTTELEEVIEKQREQLQQLQQGGITATSTEEQSLDTQESTDVGIIPPAPVPMAPEIYEEMTSSESTTGGDTSTETKPSETAFKKKFIPQPKKVEPIVKKPSKADTEPSEVDKDMTAPVSRIRSQPRVQLKDVLVSDPLAKKVYDIVRVEKTVNLRMLAMRVGTNQRSCKETVEALVETGKLEIDEGSNPSVNYVE